MYLIQSIYYTEGMETHWFTLYAIGTAFFPRYILCLNFTELIAVFSGAMVDVQDGHQSCLDVILCF